MKKILLVLGVLIGLVSLNSPSYALRAGDSSNKTYLQTPLCQGNNFTGCFVTGTSSSGQLMSPVPVPITGIAYSNGGTASTITIYDAQFAALVSSGLSCGAAGNGTCFNEVGPYEVVYEATIAANTGGYVDLSNAPINTTTGVVVFTGATSGLVVYTSNQINANH